MEKNEEFLPVDLKIVEKKFLTNDDRSAKIKKIAPRWSVSTKRTAGALFK